MNRYRVRPIVPGGFLMVALIGAAAVPALSVLATFPRPAFAAQSEIYDLEVDLQSKLAREKIKQRGPRRGSDDRGGGSGNDSANCGQVDIGNSNGNDANARNRLNPRGQTVIVTGPVINAARCR